MSRKNDAQVDQAVAAVLDLDLDPIKIKLMDAAEGHGWSRAYADSMEIEYKRHLILLLKYPEVVFAPSLDVDKFWHGHILDTLKYMADCNRIFGYYLHHFPYFGMRSAQDAANLAIAAETTSVLYSREFGNDDCNTATSSADTAYCGRASAYCGSEGRVVPNFDVLNTSVRPVLAPV